ncbi:MAG: OB-fold domain-containing protein [Acidimicrobiia bacterium]|nr:OB-fold domain-containing protein [Acidimicrobiia bacterium]
MSNVVSVAEGVLTETPEGPRLIGSRCNECGNHMFPAQEGCPRCTGTDTTEVQLEPRGTLWTWTIQGFAPKAPPYAGAVEDFEPFGVGYVELAGQVKVEARLTESDPDRLEIGMEMELVTVPLCTDEDGNDVVTFAFAPVGASS